MAGFEPCLSVKVPGPVREAGTQAVMELEGGPTSFGRALVLDTLCTCMAAPCRC